MRKLRLLFMFFFLLGLGKVHATVTHTISGSANYTTAVGAAAVTADVLVSNIPLTGGITKFRIDYYASTTATPCPGAASIDNIGIGSCFLGTSSFNLASTSFPNLNPGSVGLPAATYLTIPLSGGSLPSNFSLDNAYTFPAGSFKDGQQIKLWVVISYYNASNALIGTPETSTDLFVTLTAPCAPTFSVTLDPSNPLPYCAGNNMLYKIAINNTCASGTTNLSGMALNLNLSSTATLIWLKNSVGTTITSIPTTQLGNTTATYYALIQHSCTSTPLSTVIPTTATLTYTKVCDVPVTTPVSTANITYSSSCCTPPLTPIPGMPPSAPPAVNFCKNTCSNAFCYTATITNIGAPISNYSLCYTYPAFANPTTITLPAGLASAYTVVVSQGACSTPTPMTILGGNVTFSPTSCTGPITVCINIPTLGNVFGLSVCFGYSQNLSSPAGTYSQTISGSATGYPSVSYTQTINYQDCLPKVDLDNLITPTCATSTNTFPTYTVHMRSNFKLTTNSGSTSGAILTVSLPSGWSVIAANNFKLGFSNLACGSATVNGIFGSSSNAFATAFPSNVSGNVTVSITPTGLQVSGLNLTDLCTGSNFFIDYDILVPAGTLAGLYLVSSTFTGGTGYSTVTSTTAKINVKKMVLLSAKMYARCGSGPWLETTTVQAGSTNVTYRGTLRNDGNVPIKDISIMNSAPNTALNQDLSYTGCSSADRNSQFNLTGYGLANTGSFTTTPLLFNYSTACVDHNPTSNPLPATLYQSTTGLGALNFGACAVGGNLAGTGISPNGSIVLKSIPGNLLNPTESVSFYTNPATCTGSVGQIAYNDFSFVATRTDFNTRIPITTSNNCVVTVGSGPCTGCELVDAKLNCATPNKPTVTVKNNSGQTVSKIKINYSGSCVTPYSVTITGLSLASGATYTVPPASVPNVSPVCTLNITATLYYTYSGVIDSCSSGVPFVLNVPVNTAPVINSVAFTVPTPTFGTVETMNISASNAVTYTITAPSTNNFSPSTGSITSGTASVTQTVNGQSAGCYTVTASNAYGCTASSVICLQPNVVCFKLKTILSGCYVPASNLMSDNLRGSGTGATMIPQSPCMPADPGTCLIPLREPYTALYGTNPLTQASNIALPAVSEPAGESTTASILGVAGELGIVDWIYIELRNSVNPATVVATKRVLLARNSFAIDPVTGLNEIKFNTMPAGNYIVSVKHRNHLGLQTLNSFFLGVVGPTPCGTTIDFTLPSLPLFTLTGVTTPKVVLFSATKQGMIPGDVLKTANPTTVSFPYASSNDFNMINTILSFAAPCPANPNGQTFGYGKTDVNLDRKTNNTGATNEQLTMQQIQSIMGITGSIILSQHTSN